ncbi:MAG: hypothetical protein QOH24_94 [Verrucomicrobiota bacterium]
MGDQARNVSRPNNEMFPSESAWHFQAAGRNCATVFPVIPGEVEESLTILNLRA